MAKCENCKKGELVSVERKADNYESAHDNPLSRKPCPGLLTRAKHPKPPAQIQAFCPTCSGQNVTFDYVETKTFHELKCSNPECPKSH